MTTKDLQNGSNLMHSTRLITAFVAIPFLVCLIFLGGTVFGVFIAAVALSVADE